MKQLNVKTRDTELELIYCPGCGEMHQHLNGRCQECRTNNQSKGHCTECKTKLISIIEFLDLSEKDYEKHFQEEGVHIPVYKGYVCTKCGLQYDQHFRKTISNDILKNIVKDKDYDPGEQ